MKLPVFKAFIASFAYFFSRFGEIVKINWLPLLILQAVMIYVMPRYLDAAMQMQSFEPGADPSEVFAAMGPMFKWMGALYLPMAILYPMLIAGNLRPLIRGETTSLPFYFAFGGDEARILLAFVLWMLLIMVCYSVGVIAFLVVGGVVSLLSASIGGLVMTLGALAFCAAFFWFLLRTSLIFPATIAKRKIGLPESWQVTKRNVWGLFFYWLLWIAAFVVLAAIYMVIVMPSYFGLMKELIAAAGQDVSAQQEANRKILEWQKGMWDLSGVSGWVMAIGSYAYSFIFIAVWTIAGGMAYRFITESRTGA